MVPDLPYVRKDVPDDSEGPVTDRPFASVPSGRRPEADSSFEGVRTSTRALVRAARPDAASAHPVGWVRSAGPRARRWLAATLGGALIIGLCAQFAVADDLTDQRDALRAKQAQTKRDLNESSQALNAAAAAVDRTQVQLQSAQAQLATTRQQLAVAQAKDAALAAQLKQAQADLAAAKAAVLVGQRKLAAQKAVAGAMVRDQFQQQTNLMPIAILVESRSMADLATRVQWSSTMFDGASADIARLTQAQRVLDAAKVKQAAIETKIAADRKAAADSLLVIKNLTAQAVIQANQVAALLTQQRDEEASAAGAVAADKKQYADLTVERTQVEQRIAARIAAAKAKAAREAAARKAARIAAEKAAAARRAQEKATRAREAVAAAERERAANARAARKARSSRASDNSTSSSSSSGSSSSGSSSTKKKATATRKIVSSSSAAHGFDYPVSAPITSPYGMRFHPVLHVWKLHDGTDFGAGCGTAIRAAYSGTVAEKYYNAGYGNRLMIDHGDVDGRYVTTGYNHAIRYTVGVGDHVDQGEVIGYVGTTGFSTGCHLHLMVWLDGKMVNPMTWF